MPTTFASDEWIDALWAQLRTDDAVRSAGTTWAHGPLLLVIEPEADKGLTETVALRLDIHEGEARDLRRAEVAAASRTPFAIAGPYSRWKAAIQGTVDLVDAILQGKVRVKGDLPTLKLHKPLLAAVLAAAARVETEYPDDVLAKEPAATR